ncbi:hypothetical protein [Sphingomonas sp.]|uniref:hypothetical protein n=1 Tax=Sphingomonas sp. TaxID=28214 RepID=UPI00286EAA4C|nr:hypothetical protein [Sphingomonas sp.]
MSKVSISRAWEETRDILGRDGKLYATVAAALFLLPQTVVGLATGTDRAAQTGGTWALLLTLALVIGLVGQVAVVRLATSHNVAVGEAIRHGVRRLPSFLGAMLLLILAIGLFVLLVAFVLVGLGAVSRNVEHLPPRDVMLITLVLLVPALFMAVRLLPIAAVAGAEEVGPIGLIKRSWALTRGNFGRLAGFLVLFLIAALVLSMVMAVIGGTLSTVLFGTAAPFTLAALVMALFTAVAQAAVSLVYVVMLARIYVQLAGDGGAPSVSVPSSGT